MTFKNKLDEAYHELNIHQLYNKLRSYNNRVSILLGVGSLGKTFTFVKKMLRKAMHNTSACFVILTENQIMADMYLQNNGENLLRRQIEWARTYDEKYYQWLCNITTDGKEKGITVSGNTIKHNDRILGFCLPVTMFSKIKGGNYIVTDIYFDEAIPELETYQTKRYAEYLVSICKSVLRESNTHITITANPIRTNAPILTMFGFSKIKMGQTLKCKDKYGVFAVCHYYNTYNPKYLKVKILLDNSTADRLAYITGFTHRQEGLQNTYNTQAKFCAKYPTNLTYKATLQHDSTVHVYQHKYGLIVTDKMLTNRKSRHTYCIDRKWQSQHNSLVLDLKNTLTIALPQTTFSNYETYVDYCSILNIEPQ